VSKAPDTLAEAATLRWIKRGAEARFAVKKFDLLSPDVVATHSGLEILTAAMRGELPTPPFNATLDYWLVEASACHAVFQAQPGFAHMNPSGAAHGGWVSALLDSCASAAIYTILTPGQTLTTIQLNVNFTRAIACNQSVLRAVGDVVHRGRRVATAEGRLIDPSGAMYAHCTCVCLISDVSTAR
jgi:uncharacterized protein (TIGR00369 family)